MAKGKEWACSAVANSAFGMFLMLPRPDSVDKLIREHCAGLSPYLNVEVVNRGGDYYHLPHLCISPHGLGILTGRPTKSVQNSCREGRVNGAVKDMIGYWAVPVRFVVEQYDVTQHIADALMEAENIIQTIYPAKDLAEVDLRATD